MGRGTECIGYSVCLLQYSGATYHAHPTCCPAHATKLEPSVPTSNMPTTLFGLFRSLQFISTQCDYLVRVDVHTFTSGSSVRPASLRQPWCKRGGAGTGNVRGHVEKRSGVVVDSFPVVGVAVAAVSWCDRQCSPCQSTHATYTRVPAIPVMYDFDHFRL